MKIAEKTSLQGTKKEIISAYVEKLKRLPGGIKVIHLVISKKPKGDEFAGEIQGYETLYETDTPRFIKFGKRARGNVLKVLKVVGNEIRYLSK